MNELYESLRKCAQDNKVIVVTATQLRPTKGYTPPPLRLNDVITIDYINLMKA